MNVLGHFFTKVYQTLKEEMNKKVERIINEESKIMNLNQNTMREVYFNTDQICEIF